ncbi:hypothetical protein ACERII_20170 [Evansella sp. AB-rgal1]|uniref:hypothetical protein n=1 Tax=Evansella sp. AB-rgal1 TaxID=3242696 RepID=UPI00359DFB54
MKNRIYYLSLNFLSLLLLIYTFKNAKVHQKRYLIPLYLSFTGINYLFEFFVLVIGRAYEYKPTIFKQTYFDNIFGSNVSQLFVIPTTALFISVFHLKYKWFLFFASLLTFIERIFIKHNVFKLNWWRTPFTSIGVQLFYTLAKVWNTNLTEKHNKIIERATIFLAVFVSYATFNFYHVAILKTCFFNLKLFSNSYRSHVTYSSIYSFICSFFFTLSVHKKKWKHTLLTMISFLGIEFIFIKNNWIIIAGKYFYIISLLTKVGSIQIGNYVFELIHENKNE